MKVLVTERCHVHVGQILFSCRLVGNLASLHERHPMRVSIKMYRLSLGVARSSCLGDGGEA